MTLFCQHWYSIVSRALACGAVCRVMPYTKNTLFDNHEILHTREFTHYTDRHVCVHVL